MRIVRAPLKVLSLVVCAVLSLSDTALPVVGQAVKKFTWLLDNVEVQGVVRWIDPIQDGTEPDIFRIRARPELQHLISLLPGNNPMMFQPVGSVGVLQCETYPLTPLDINRSDSWSLPRKPNQPFEVIIDPVTHQKRPLQVGDHIRVVGRLVIDHHPEWCDMPSKFTPPEPSRCRHRGWLKVGPAHMELHPIRWDDIQLVYEARYHEAVSETLSLAARLYVERVYRGGGKHIANEIAGVASKIFIHESAYNYHERATAIIRLKAPPIPGFSPRADLVGFERVCTSQWDWKEPL